MKEMTPNPPLRQGSQQGSLSAKTRRVLKLYEDDLRLRYSDRTGPHYLADVGLKLPRFGGRVDCVACV